MNVSIRHFLLVIGMILFPALAQIDLSRPSEVFAQMPTTTVHLLAETLQPGEDQFDEDLGGTTISDRSIR